MPRPFLECAIRAALLPIGAATVLWAMRIKTASLKHRVWTVAMLVMLVLPAWATWGPTVPLRILPASTERLINGAGSSVAILAADSPAHLPTLGAKSLTPMRPAVPRSYIILLSVYLLGCLWLLVRLFVGTVKANAFVQRAAVQNGKYTSVECAAPVTVGFLHPKMILPDGWTQWPQARLDAVLIHESEHVRRRDPLVQWFALLNRAVWWFHPASWWLERKLSGLAEETCDDAVLARGCDPYDYAKTLLHMADAVVRSRARINSGAMAMPGSALPQRIRRIAKGLPATRISPTRAGCLIFCSVFTCTMFAAAAFKPRQSAEVPQWQNLTGIWQGTLELPNRSSRIVIKISRSGDENSLTGLMYSIDQGGTPMRAGMISLIGSVVKITIPGIGGTYDGTISTDGNSIKGAWTLGGTPMPLPLDLVRATPETAWAIPDPPVSPKPMAPDADPVFEVASIKLSPPGPRNKGIRIVGRQLLGTDQTVSDLIKFSYGLQTRQISGGPPWLASELFDTTAEPDGEGQPSNQQWKIMVQKLLADRFKFSFHREKQELPVYTLSAASGGPKLTPSADDPNTFPSIASRLGNVIARDASMNDLAALMQFGMDRPVLDQTGLAGKFDFTLNWTPDEFQVSAGGVNPLPQVDPNKAPPDLYKAIQEQLGLKLESKKAPVDVIVIDHIEEPSPN